MVGRLAATVAVAVPLFLALGVGTAAASPTLQSTGSSFAGVAIQQWVGQAATLLGLNINWQVSSSVLGLQNFAQNLVDFGASDIPYSSGQSAYTPTVPYEYMPDVAGALAFMYNLTGKTGTPITNLILNASIVEGIFTGTITTWNAAPIANLNPQLAGDLPSTTIVPVFREDASGENYLLSDYLLHLDPAPFTAYQTAMQGNPEVPGQPGAQWPIPVTGVPYPPGYPGWNAGNMIGESGSDNVANYVSAASSNGAITYVETAYAKEHNEPVASLVNASGAAVQPTSVNDATALEDAILHADLTQDLSGVYTNPLPNAYPISAYSYLVTPCDPALAAAQSPPTSCTGSGANVFPTAKGQALGQFVAFLACAGQQKMAVLGYSPLPPNLVQEDFDAIGRIEGGQQPPPVSAATCKNPYVDGQTPLPGEPAVIGQAAGTPGAGATTAANAVTGPGGSKAVTGSTGVGGTGGSDNGAAGTVGSAQGGPIVIQKGSVAADGSVSSLSTVPPGPNPYQRDDGLTAAATSLLRGLSPGAEVALWCAVLAVLLGAPPLFSFWRRRRRRRAEIATTTPIRVG